MIDSLIEKINQHKNPTVVGLDPRAEMIPDYLKEKAFDIHGKNYKALAAAYLEFNQAIIDALFDIVPAIKPQIAFYEALGVEGLKAYIETIHYAKEKNMLVIGDIKRSDIGTSAEAYAKGHLEKPFLPGNSENFEADFITINPFLGMDSIQPFVEVATAGKKGLFVLLKTSNPGASDIQNLLVDGKPLYIHLGNMIKKQGEGLIGIYGYSLIGAVVSATHPAEALTLRENFKQMFFLVPGYGAQGATGKDIASVFNTDGQGAIINNSRGITYAYANGNYLESEFALAARDAAITMQKDILSHI